MGFHYKFNASEAHRWTKCPGSKALGKTIPRRPAGDAAITGTAAHFLAEWAMSNGYGSQVDDRLVGTRIRINADGDAVQLVTGPGVGTDTGFAGIQWDDDPTATSPDFPTVITVDESMVKAVAMYTNTVSGILAKYTHTAKRHIEVGFQLAMDMGGMADMVIVVPGRLIVLDYKNGYNPVDAKDNMQLAMYGVGALEKFAHGPKAIQDVVMGIVQPNSKDGKNLKTWAQTKDEMIVWRDFFESRRRIAIEVGQAFDAGRDIAAHCITGDHCKWCESSPVCPAMQSQTMALANRTLTDLDAPQTPNPADLDDARLVWIAKNGDAIKDFIDQCVDHMTYTATHDGKVWPGFKVVESNTKRRIKDKYALTEECKAAGLHQAFEPKLKGIGKLGKLIGVDRLAKHIEKPAGTPTLVPEEDGREEYTKQVLAMVPSIERKD